MKQKNIYILSLTALLTMVFLIGKAAFVIYNRDIEALTIGQFFNAWVHGLLLDLRTAGLLLIIPALAVTFMRTGLRKVLVAYFCIIAFVVATIIVADMVMYEFWEFKLCAVHLAYAASPEGTTNSVSIWFLVVRLLTLFAFLLLIAVPAILMIPKEVKGKRDIRSLCLVILLALLPIGVKNCYHAGTLFRSHAATNPVYRFATSFFDERGYRSIDIDNTTSVSFATSGEITDTLLRADRPNILVVMMESFSGKFIKELGGIPDVAPNFSRLVPEGILWDQYYSNSFRTDRGTVCAYSGWTSYPTISPMKNEEMHPYLSSLPQSLIQVGYQTGYMYAGPMTNMGKERYLADMNFQTLLDHSYFSSEELNSSWGANDSTSAMKLYHMLAEITPTAQWMMVWQTISSHEPWDVPYHRLDDKRLNAFAYTDQCLGDLVDSLKALPVWDNLLVIVIPDHGFLYDQTYDTGEFFHSPMLWLGGAIREPRQMSVLMNQSDIAATLLAQLKLPYKQYPWSRNVLAPDYDPFVYCTYPAGLFYKDKTGETMYDLTAQMTLPVGEPSDTLRLRKALGILKRSYSEIPQP